MTELNVLSLCFLPVPVCENTYALSILHRDYTGTLQLLTRDLSIHRQELSIEPSRILPQIVISEDDARALVPIPATDKLPAGVLVIGGRNILFFEAGEPRLADKGKGREKYVKGQFARKRSSSTSAPGPRIEPRAQVDWQLSDLTA